MACSDAVDSAILFQNAAQTVTLVDIPRSIALAQSVPKDSNASASSFREPLSTKPSEIPFLSTEPKPEKRRRFPDSQHGSFPAELLAESLRLIRTNIESRSWCLARKVWSSQAFETKSDIDKELLEVVNESPGWSVEEPMLLATGMIQVSATKIRDRLVCNRHSSEVQLKCRPMGMNIHIPPLSGFLLSRIAPATVMSFSMAALLHYPGPSTATRAGAGEFDLMVLDPPWPNRSVRRSRKYQTLEENDEPLEALRNILGQHIAPGALVACWITNKSAVKDSALALLAGWGLELIEEWAWLKITEKGEPVSELEGVWRKTYEILLVSRKPGCEGPLSEYSREDPASVFRRVIVGVPDIHSRKPSLRKLLAQLLPRQMSDYRCLEIFARNLTAGWWSWGNEVLKYNDALAWSSADYNVDPGEHALQPGVGLTVA